MTTKTGLDVLLGSDAEKISGRRYALLAHFASVTQDLEPAHLVLTREGHAPALLLAPEHGYYGVEQDMVASDHQLDPLTGVPIHSLYGDSRDSLFPDPDLFLDIDLLVVDLQDIGCRYYTYAATGIWAAAAALGAGCEVWILDRPNPLGGRVIEGNRRRPGFESFVGAFEIPARHHLTLGELARWVLSQGGNTDGLKVVPMTGWRRDHTWENTGRAFVAPSPNMPTMSTCWVYPGLCLLEATTLSEGRGTTRPFQVFGAPHLNPDNLAGQLRELDLPGVAFIPTYFRPQFHKHEGRVCGGVEMVVTDRALIEPYRSGVEVLRVLYELSQPETFWRKEAYEFESALPAVDLLTGDGIYRELLERDLDLSEWMETWAHDCEAFRESTREVLLYPEKPRHVK